LIKKGGKSRRRGKNDTENDKRELVFKEEGQGNYEQITGDCNIIKLNIFFIIEYAQVTKMLGNGRVDAQCFDGVKRLATIRGKLRKKVWINQGDIVLLSLREFQDEKADVIQRYNPDEARQLKSYGELPDNAKINEADTNFGGEEEDDVEFDFDIDDVKYPFINSIFYVYKLIIILIDLNHLAPPFSPPFLLLLSYYTIE
jgi:translation initiation factor 1A